MSKSSKTKIEMNTKEKRNTWSTYLEIMTETIFQIYCGDGFQNQLEFCSHTISLAMLNLIKKILHLCEHLLNSVGKKFSIYDPF